MEQSNNKRVKTEDKAVPWSELPSELLELILQCLPVSDYPYFTSVCKSWKSVTPTVYPVYRNPLLLKYKTARNNTPSWHCYDPFLNKNFKVDSPIDLSNYKIIFGKDEWLLAHRDSDIMLVNPFTGVFHQYHITVDELIENIWACFHGVPPNDCMIFLVYDLRFIPMINVPILFYDGKRWSFRNFICEEYFEITSGSNPVFFNDGFYCLGTEGVVGVYNPEKNSWGVLEKIPSKYFCTHCEEEDSFLVESGEQLLVVRIINFGKLIRVFRLEQVDMTWRETHNLDDQSLFVSRMTLSVAPLERKFRNKVYLPWFYGVSDVVEADVVNSNGKLLFKPKSLPCLNHEGVSRRKSIHEIYCYQLEKCWHSGFIGYWSRTLSIWFHHKHP